MLCPQGATLNAVTMIEATRLPHRKNPSRAAGSFPGHIGPISPVEGRGLCPD